MTISPATPADLDEICGLVNSAYRGESSRVGWTTEADLLGGQRTDLTSLKDDLDRGTILLYRNEEQSLVACVYLERTCDGGAYLGMLTVDPRRQAGGVGRRLLTAAETFARSRWGATRVQLGVVHVRESLIAWYERRGYRRTGETKPFPYGDERFGIPRRDDLRFEMFEKNLETAPCA